MATRFAFWRKEEEAAAGEEHAQPGLLSDFILGSQDGLVNVLGVLLGVAIAAANSTAVDPFRIILAGGLAATFAESISMGRRVHVDPRTPGPLPLRARPRGAGDARASGHRAEGGAGRLRALGLRGPGARGGRGA